MRALDRIIPRLRSQMQKGQPVLFTGAGFSLSACDRDGRRLPSTTELRDALHAIAFPGDPLDPDAAIGDTFSVAMSQNQHDTRALLESRLSVDPKSLPEYYRYFYDQPWRRIYTLNFDDLEMAVANRFDLPRSIKSISATCNTDNEDSTNPRGSQLEVVHLNGCVTDSPADLTFSEQQYAQQIIAPNRWYIRCVEDLRTRPVIYVGTELRESTLWTYVELRIRRNRQTDVLSPGSILVTPTLSRAREALLKEYNVYWIPMTAEQFSVVLQELRDATQQGFVFIKQYDDN